VGIELLVGALLFSQAASGVQQSESARKQQRQRKIATEDAQKRESALAREQSGRLRSQVEQRQRGFGSLVKTSPLGVSGARQGLFGGFTEQQRRRSQLFGAA